MQTINACPRGHRYRASVIHRGLQTPCSRCDRLALVTLAYGDCQQPQRGCRSLGFKTEYITDFQEFCELLGVIGRYNAFHPVKVINELRPIFSKLMGVEIGREGSPVIYGYPAYWTHQEVRWQGVGSGTRIPDEERSAVCRSFLDAMGRAHADELTDSGHSLRAWWD